MVYFHLTIGAPATWVVAFRFPNLPSYLLRKLKCKERSHVTQQDILQGSKERCTARAASCVAYSPPRMTRTKVSPSKESTATIDPEEKLAEDIKRHLGIEINGSFHGDLTPGEKVEAGTCVDVAANQDFPQHPCGEPSRIPLSAG